MNTEYAALAFLACFSTGAFAQSPERWEALHAQPRGSAALLTRDGGLNTYFIYQYDNQTLPIVDDFSVDRTRHLDATPSSPGVTPGPVFYQLQVAGSSTPGMAFEDDSTYHVTVDTAGTDVFTSVANPSIEVVVFDLSVYPPTTDTLDLWPPYNIRDTVGDPTSDTILVAAPDLVQDSLLVFIVPPFGGTYTNPDNSVKPLILWEEDEAYINGTYPVEPPSIGVASFDGMDRTGYPYSPENPNQQGIADHLTSVPIDLLGIASDSVYLSFFYQPRGLSGDVDVDPTDSLRLEFYSPSQDRWYLEWSTPYPTGDQPFRQVMMPIVLQQFLQNGFRMRFSNRGTLGGAVDHWHIDYVRLGKQRSLADTLLQDVTFVYPANSLTAPYTSVPYDRFTASPGTYMAGNVDLVQRNLFNVSALITWGYEVSTDCGSNASFVGPGSNIGSNAGTIFTAANPINSAPHDFQYDLNSCSEAAFATTKFWTLANPDALRYNDTTTVVQEISNYYSYDDGSAEQGYWLNAAGGRIAYRFDTQGLDSLKAVRMYFDPIFTYGDIPNDPRDGSFLLTVWQDLNSDPIFQNISFSSPEYRLWGPDQFVEYALDSTIQVGGTFYVGWTQTNGVKMNLGLDKNRLYNDRMFYNVGNGWLQSSAPGSWMIRPVMSRAVDPFAGVTEQALGADLLIYPNPATDAVRLRIDGDMPHTIQLLDPTGRQVLLQRYRQDEPIPTVNLAEGLYMLRALDKKGRAFAQQRLIVQR